MIFTPVPLPGAYVIDLEPYYDTRGFFSRSWDQREFSERGLSASVEQSNISYNRKRGTLRGLHYQLAPYSEVKLVRCTRGAIWDIIVDMRPDSPAYRQSFGIKLTHLNRSVLYVPEGFAHGLITLSAYTEVFYQVSRVYTPEAERGVRWNDPVLKIEWPIPVEVVSDKDANWPDLE